MKDNDRVFEDKLQKGGIGDFAEKDLRNRKHRPKARKRRTETRVFKRT